MKRRLSLVTVVLRGLSSVFICLIFTITYSGENNLIIILLGATIIITIGLSNCTPLSAIHGFAYPAPASCLAQIITPPGHDSCFACFTRGYVVLIYSAAWRLFCSELLKTGIKIHVRC